MRSLALLGFLVGSAFRVSAETLHYVVFYNGAPAGAQNVSVSASGAVQADSLVNIGPVTLKEIVAAQFAGPTLQSSDGTTESPNGTVHVQYANGKITVDAGKMHKELAYKPAHDFYGGSLMVWFWSSSAAEALRQLGASGDQPSAAVTSYLVDGGTELPAVFRRLPARKAVVNGKEEIAKALQINFAGVQGELDVDSSGRVVAMDVPGQKIRFLLDGWKDLYVDPLAKYPELSQPTYKTVTDKTLKMTTRDGVFLAATAIRPDAPGQFPTVLERTPYDRASAAVEGEFYAKRGYVFVSQDVRGRGESTGEWDPFVHEGEDGFDTISWIAKQPWSNGRVGMIGGSYGGYVQWAAAVLKPPALKCIVPQVSPPDAMHNLPYDFGVPFIYGDLWWAKIVAGSKLDFSSLKGPLPHPEKLTVLPLGKADEAVLGINVPFLSEVDYPNHGGRLEGVRFSAAHPGCQRARSSDQRLVRWRRHWNEVDMGGRASAWQARPMAHRRPLVSRIQHRQFYWEAGFWPQRYHRPRQRLPAMVRHLAQAKERFTGFFAPRSGFRLREKSVAEPARLAGPHRSKPEAVSDRFDELCRAQSCPDCSSRRHRDLHV